MLSIKFIVLCSNKWIDISVPCRGTTFLNTLETCRNGKAYPSFRPLSGNYISQSYSEYDLIESPAMFPSPVGELHFSIGSWCYGRLDSYHVSVPCRGTTFLNKFYLYFRGLYRWFPSPVGELHFSINSEACKSSQ